MHRSIADELYDENWDQAFTSLDDLYHQIHTLAMNGAYEVCVRIDKFSVIEEVRQDLIGKGYDVENHNGYADILSISWG